MAISENQFDHLSQEVAELEKRYDMQKPQALALIARRQIWKDFDVLTRKIIQASKNPITNTVTL